MTATITESRLAPAPGEKTVKRKPRARKTGLNYPADQVRALQAYYGFGVYALAKKAKVSVTTLNHALQGRPITPAKFAQIARALNADVEIVLRPRDKDFIAFATSGLPTGAEPTPPAAGGE